MVSYKVIHLNLNGELVPRSQKLPAITPAFARQKKSKIVFDDNRFVLQTRLHERRTSKLH